MKVTAAMVVVPALFSATFAGAQQAGETSPFRYDDDLSVYASCRQHIGCATLKYIPFGQASYLSFGGDIRERVETRGAGLLGFRTKSPDTYDLHRVLLHANGQFGENLRLFVQFGYHDQTGRTRAAPTDVDRFDIQQGFVDVSAKLANGRGIIRVGRAEMSFDDGALIGLRDGPNVRQAWDGVRLSYAAPQLLVDGFAVRPVSVSRGSFDDRSSAGQTLQGVRVTANRLGGRSIGVDAFYYRNTDSRVQLAVGLGRERTDTIGMRVRGQRGPVDYSVGLIRQSGRFGDRPVRALAAHADLGLSLPQPWRPHIAVRVDVLSGGAATPTVHTFNALYPNVAYSTDATIEAPANLVETGLVAKLTPVDKLAVQYSLGGL